MKKSRLQGSKYNRISFLWLKLDTCICVEKISEELYTKLQSKISGPGPLVIFWIFTFFLVPLTVAISSGSWESLYLVLGVNKSPFP